MFLYSLLFCNCSSEIKRSYQASATADEVILKRQQDIEDSWKESMRINDEWNAQLAIEREERDKLVMQKRFEQADREMKAEDAKRAAKQAYYDQLIREQQVLLNPLTWRFFFWLDEVRQ